jgi:formate hydrogenlyase subunit 4
LDGQQPLGIDLLAVVLLLQLPALVTLVVGTLASSIYAQVAAARVAQLMVACLTPYVVAMFGPAIVLGTLDFKLVAANVSHMMLAVKFACGLGLLICLPAQLRTRPLAASAGETLEGVTTNIAGVPLGLFRLMGWVERIAVALVFAALFVPFAATNGLVLVGGVLLVLGLVGVLEVLFSQIRLKDALNFYLRYASIGAAAWLVVLVLLIRL